MTQNSAYWPTVSASSDAIGDQVTGYTPAVEATLNKVLAACSGYEGVAPSYLNSLAGTVTGANTVQINTGGALVDGHPYYNDAAVSVTIDSAVGGGNTRIDRIVLRCVTTDCDVSISLTTGIDAASPTAPALVQTPGGTYDIALYQALVNTSGAVTLTDERTYAATGSIIRRQGGSATVWSTPGVTNYPSVLEKKQMGAVTWSGVSHDHGSVTITFPSAYTNAPIGFATLVGDVNPEPDVVVAVTTTATQLTIYWRSTVAPYSSLNFNWLAIGPA